MASANADPCGMTKADEVQTERPGSIDPGRFVGGVQGCLEDEATQQLELAGTVDDVGGSGRGHELRRRSSEGSKCTVATASCRRTELAEVGSACGRSRVGDDGCVHREDVAVVGEVEGFGRELEAVLVVDGEGA